MNYDSNTIKTLHDRTTDSRVRGYLATELRKDQVLRSLREERQRRSWEQGQLFEGVSLHRESSGRIRDSLKVTGLALLLFVGLYALAVFFLGVTP